MDKSTNHMLGNFGVAEGDSDGGCWKNFQNFRKTETGLLPVKTAEA